MRRARMRRRHTRTAGIPAGVGSSASLPDRSPLPPPAPFAIDLPMSKPIVRFAPSPTGRIHIGNARMALLNALYRAAGGRHLHPALRRHGSGALEAGICGFHRGRSALARHPARHGRAPVGAVRALRRRGRAAEGGRAGSIPATRRRRSWNSAASASSPAACRRSTTGPP